jgi:histidinol phosphatase-like enzyme
VLFDRDGTLVRDVPYNGRPELVEAMPGAAEAVARLRSGASAAASSPASQESDAG